jgi:Uma2 family endonuclease
MATVILDQEFANDLIAERRKNGSDRRDEVWEGVYMMAPMPNDEHLSITSDLCAIFKIEIEWQGKGVCREGANVSDRIKNWTENYRIPDVCVMLKGGESVNHKTFWYGGPDLTVEVCSPSEDPHKKIAFYESVGVRELLVIDRNPWKLELFRLTRGKLKLLGKLTSIRSPEIVSEVIPFAFRFVKGAIRPGIAVRNTNTDEVRTI